MADTRTHWKHRATRCAIDGCERTRHKGWTTCALFDHYPLGVSLYGLRPGDPRTRMSESGREPRLSD